MVITPAVSGGHSGTFPSTGTFVGTTVALTSGGRVTNPADSFDCTVRGTLNVTRP
jgi:hypothetical protein